MLTAADLKGRKTVGALHVDFSRSKSATIFGVEGVPRLTAHDVSEPNLETALAVINGEKKLEDVVSDEVTPPARPKPPKKRLSLQAQIAEIDYELGQREKVYPRIASSDPGRKGELELHVERLQTVRETLVWLSEHEALIKQRLSY